MEARKYPRTLLDAAFRFRMAVDALMWLVTAPLFRLLCRVTGEKPAFEFGDRVQVDTELVEFWLAHTDFSACVYDFSIPGEVIGFGYEWGEDTVLVFQESKRWGRGSMPVPLRMVSAWDDVMHHVDVPEDDHYRVLRMAKG